MKTFFLTCAFKLKPVGNHLEELLPTIVKAQSTEQQLCVRRPNANVPLCTALSAPFYTSINLVSVIISRLYLQPINRTILLNSYYIFRFSVLTYIFQSHCNSILSSEGRRPCPFTFFAHSDVIFLFHNTGKTTTNGKC